MSKRFIHRFILFCATLLVMASVRPGQASGVMIVQSSAIEAYQQAVSGFNQGFITASMPGIASIQPTQALILDPGPAGTAEIVNTVNRKYQDLQPNLIVAVGTAALEAVRDLPGPTVYLMVPNPEAVIGQRTTITGIRMSTGPEQQLLAIKAAFPAIKTIGLLHNPATSGEFPRLAGEAAERLKLTLVNAPAASDREAIILATGLTDRIEAIEALLLTPDPAIISKNLLNALALVSLEKGIPLIGFAPKYLDHGAAMVIFTSPEQMGRQAASMAKSLIGGPHRGLVQPEYGKEATVLTNSRIMKTLGIIPGHSPTMGGSDSP